MKSIFNIVIFHFATLNNQRVTEKKQKNPKRKRDVLLWMAWFKGEWSGFQKQRKTREFTVGNMDLLLLYCILIFVNGLAEGGIEQNRIGLSQ